MGLSKIWDYLSFLKHNHFLLWSVPTDAKKKIKFIKMHSSVLSHREETEKQTNETKYITSLMEVEAYTLNPINITYPRNVLVYFWWACRVSWRWLRDWWESHKFSCDLLMQTSEGESFLVKTKPTCYKTVFLFFFFSGNRNFIGVYLISVNGFKNTNTTVMTVSSWVFLWVLIPRIYLHRYTNISNLNEIHTVIIESWPLEQLPLSYYNWVIFWTLRLP